jgi:GTPase involved in cell partitioning and DNA repair
VVLVADPALTDLLHLQLRELWEAPSGGRANRATAARLSGGPGGRGPRPAGARAGALELRVPVGTAVKGRRQLVGELRCPGDRLVVARGGAGGRGVALKDGPHRGEGGGGGLAGAGGQAQQEDALGSPGEQAKLQLVLRLPADVGLVGLPNAGKSSLLAALTRAAPEVGDFPFTTLVPNLGVVSGEGPAYWEEGEGAASWEGSGGEAEVDAGALEGTVLADLPGLIEGAHAGRGLGRLFLRHLREARVVCHVVDASQADPAGDYAAVRRELRLYNEEYVERPHVVVLSKADLCRAADPEGAAERLEALQAAVARGEEGGGAAEGAAAAPPPAAVVVVSSREGDGLAALRSALDAALAALGGWD